MKTGWAVAIFLLSTTAFAINTVTDGYKVDNGTTVEIDAHSTCKDVTNNSGAAQFVATNTSTEWSSFLAHLPTGMTTANCAPSDPCGASPSPGDTCTGGAIYLGSLSPGAMSGTGTDHYMTTPGGCTNSATPTCSGTDSLKKVWNGSGGSYANIAALVDYFSTIGTGYGASNKDQNYGSANTAAILADASIGPDSAAAYCDNLIYGGYSDWYLPNRYELYLFFTNKSSLPGLNSGNWYWSSTEDNTGTSAWVQLLDGRQNNLAKGSAYFVRCVRRF